MKAGDSLKNTSSNLKEAREVSLGFKIWLVNEILLLRGLGRKYK